MSQFYASFFDLYWDLHVGAQGEAIPAEVREFSTSFNAVFGYALPTSEVVYENYMRARALRPALRSGSTPACRRSSTASSRTPIGRWSTTG